MEVAAESDVETAAAVEAGDVVEVEGCVDWADGDWVVEEAVLPAGVLDVASDVDVVSGETELEVKSGRREEEVVKSSKVKAREERA